MIADFDKIAMSAEAVTFSALFWLYGLFGSTLQDMDILQLMAFDWLIDWLVVD